MERRAIVSWDEEDAYTKWRKYYIWKPGVLKKIKRVTHKRERRGAVERELKTY